MSDEGRAQGTPEEEPQDANATDERRKPQPYRALGPNTSAAWVPEPDDLEHAEALEEAYGVAGVADDIAKSSSGGAEAVVGRWDSPVGRVMRTVLAFIVFFAIVFFVWELF